MFKYITSSFPFFPSQCNQYFYSLRSPTLETDKVTARARTQNNPNRQTPNPLSTPPLPLYLPTYAAAAT